MMLSLLGIGCGLPKGPPGTPPIDDTSAGDTAAASDSGLITAPPIDTAWPLDTGCVDALDVDLDLLREEDLLLYGGAPTSDDCVHLHGAIATSDSGIATLLDDHLDGHQPWSGGLDVSDEQALILYTSGCNGHAHTSIVRLQRCVSGRMVVDANQPGNRESHPGQEYFVLSIPLDPVIGITSRVRLCNSGQPCMRFLDGVLQP